MALGVAIGLGAVRNDKTIEMLACIYSLTFPSDINVAYGRSATFADINGASSNTPLITDGIASVDEGAQCILLKRGGGAYFTINLDTQLPVREVVIVGKPGTTSSCYFVSFNNDNIS